MPTKRAPRRPAPRASVHVTMPADLVARLRAFSGYHGRDMGDVVADGVRHVLRGFSARQDPAPTARPTTGEGPPPPPSSSSSAVA